MSILSSKPSPRGVVGTPSYPLAPGYYLFYTLSLSGCDFLRLPNAPYGNEGDIDPLKFKPGFTIIFNIFQIQCNQN